MDRKISVIVPVYKVEKYLNECVDSIINQTYKNLEIILVDDGSPDNCPELCDIWAQKDNRIKVIHKKNGGLSDARNVGIKNATGDYISFIDSDDYIINNFYEIALKSLIENNAQVFICGRYYLYGLSKKRYQKKNIKLVMNSEESIDKMNSFGYYDVASWDKVYERKLFDNIEFPTGKLSEDWYTTYKLLDRATTIVYDSSPFYVYRQRSNSITHSDNVKINIDPIIASKEVLDFIKIKYPIIVLNALTRYIYASIGVYNNLIMYDSTNKENIRKILNNIRDSYKEIKNNKNISFLRKTQLVLLVKVNFLYKRCIIMFKKYKEYKSR